jgi:hypothetical protein
MQNMLLWASMDQVSDYVDQGANIVGFFPATGHLKTEVELTSETLWFKNA